MWETAIDPVSIPVSVIVPVSPASRALFLQPHDPLELFVKLVEELRGGQPALIGGHQQRQVLGHEALLDRAHAHRLKRLGEVHHLRRVVELTAVEQATGPGVDRCNRVGRGLLTLLVQAVVTGNGAVCSLGFDGLAVGGMSTEVIRPNEPKPCATVSDWTSPS